jgi:hypothetical protein
VVGVGLSVIGAWVWVGLTTGVVVSATGSVEESDEEPTVQAHSIVDSSYNVII